ncbi:NCA2-domain-containing protein [Atractiella rhizophila]|nr:NCA2-domain-containing protein [Atractiella rhizophila]
MASFASESTRFTASSLDVVSQALLNAPSPSLAPRSQAVTFRSQATSRAQAGIKALNLASSSRLPTRENLLKIIRDTFLDAEAEKGDLEIGIQQEVEAEELLLLAQVVTGAYGVAMHMLLQEAGRYENELDYWRVVEGDPYDRVTYLIQTLPARLLRTLQTLQQRLRLHTTPLFSNGRTHLPSLTDIRHALPPSILLTSLFPHLSRTSSQPTSTRSILFLAISPLTLTRQEAKAKREELKRAKDVLATKLGVLAREKARILDGLVQNEASISRTRLQDMLSEAVEVLDRNLATSSMELKGKSKAIYPPSASAAGENIQGRLLQLLSRRFPSHTQFTSSELNSLSRPSFMSRTWPALVLGPVALFFGIKYVFNRKAEIREWYLNARETVEGFVWGWVVQPVKDILGTIRGGEEHGLTLMGGDSLKSDLDSLNRMVVDFARENYNVSQSELDEIGRKVKEGDITTVLTAWEKDIKKPLRSAVSGSLIRTLLIQVQKVKVDVALAMDGIQKMLRSQQLTFGFVGVAPSMMILYLSGLWARSAFTGSGRSKRHERVRALERLRYIDVLLTSSSESSEPSGASGSSRSSEGREGEDLDLLAGNLLVSLDLLRKFANSKAFPKDARLKRMFLEDVRTLEGTQTRLEVKRTTVRRMWAVWGGTSTLE